MSILWTASIAYGYPVTGKASQGMQGFGSTAIGSTVVDTLETNIGKRMPVVNINLRMMDGGVLQGFNATMKTALQAVWDYGAIPFCNFGAWDLGNRGNNYSLRLGAHAAGTWDTYWNQFFTEAAAWGHPFWIRPWWEFNVQDGWVANGNFPWCVGTIVDGGNTWTNTAADYVNAWRRVKTIALQKGAKNVAFCWCPNIKGTGGKTATAGALSQYWPGFMSDGTPYVDWSGPDGYQQGYPGGSIGGTYAEFSKIFRGGTGTGLQDTWGEMMALDPGGKIPMCIPETNVDFNAIGNTEANRAAYIKEMFETSIPSLPRMQLLSLFWWWDSAVRYAWDESITTPNTDGTVKFDFTTPSWQQALKSFGSSYYIDKAPGFTLPSDLGPIRPVWLSNQTDRYRKIVRSTFTLKGYWRGVEVSGNLADDSGLGRTAIAAGSPSYSQTSVVPSNPSDGSIGFAGGTTTSFSPGDNDDFSAPTTTAITLVVSFAVTSFPPNNAHLIAKGQSGQYEYSVYVDNAGEIVLNVWNLSASTGTSVRFTGPISLNTPYLAHARIDTTNTLVDLVVNGNTAGHFSGGLVSGHANGTSPLMLGRRSDPSDISISGRIGHWQVYDRWLSDNTIQDQYNAWIAAPTLASVTAGTPTNGAVAITWTTNNPATSYVEYGLTTSYGQDSGLIDPALVTSHSITLTGLGSGTYHYRVHSKTAGGTETISGDATFFVPSGLASPIWWGAWHDDETSTGDTVSNGLETSLGKRPSIVILNHPWWFNGYVTFSSIASHFALVRSHGQIPLLGWQNNSWSGTPTSSMSNANVVAGAHDSFLQTFADGVAALGYPIMILLDEEMNGSWNPWYDAAGTTWVAMWKHVVDIFRARGANNVSWVWCANGLVPGGSFSAWWPGSNYVDWAVVDVFNSGYAKGNPWITFDQMMHGDPYAQWGDSWTALQALDPTGKVKLGLGSFGSEQRNQTGTDYSTQRAAWIADAYGTQIPGYGTPARDYTRLKMVLFWNQDEPNASLSDGREHWDIANDTPSTNAFSGPNGPGGSNFYVPGNEFVLPSGMGVIQPYEGTHQPNRFINAIRHVSPANLIGHWRNNAASGSTITDTGPNGYNGSYTGGFSVNQPSIITAVTDPTVLFNGTTGYGSVPNNAAFSFTTTGKLTIVAIAKLATMPAAGSYATIVSKAGAYPSYEYSIRVYSDGTFEVVSWDPTGATYASAGSVPAAISAGVPFMVAAMFDISKYPGGGTVRLAYMKLSDPAPTFTDSTDYSGFTPSAGSGNLEFGRRGDNSQYGNVYVSHVAMWKIAISDLSVAEIFNMSKLRRTQPHSFVAT
jgi:beta-mannanase